MCMLHLLCIVHVHIVLNHRVLLDCGGSAANMPNFEDNVDARRVAVTVELSRQTYPSLVGLSTARIDPARLQAGL